MRNPLLTRQKFLSTYVRFSRARSHISIQFIKDITLKYAMFQTGYKGDLVSANRYVSIQFIKDRMLKYAMFQTGYKGDLDSGNRIYIYSVH